MQKRQVLTVVLLTVAVGMVSRYAGHSQQTKLNVKPFTATKVIMSFSSQTGEYLTARQQQYAIRSDGTQVVWMTKIDPLGQPKISKTVYDVPLERKRSADELTESYVTTPMSGIAHSLQHRAGVCAGQPLASERVFGYEVVRTEDEFAIPTPAGGRFRHVRYQAPSLNCYTMREEAYKSKGDGPLVRFEVKEVVSLLEGEPDPSLFELPEGYTERTPTEMLREFGRRHSSQAMSEEKLQKLHKLDEAYWMKRSQSPAR